MDFRLPSPSRFPYQADGSFDKCHESKQNEKLISPPTVLTMNPSCWINDGEAERNAVGRERKDFQNRLLFSLSSLGMPYRLAIRSFINGFMGCRSRCSI